jgi:hypothetical protein
MSEEQTPQTREELLKELHNELGATPKLIKRPSWGFDLNVAMLPPVPDGNADVFTEAQLATGKIALDFIYLAADEETDSIADAALACAKRRMNVAVGQPVLVQSRVKHSLWKVNGRVLDPVERDRLWSRIGPECRDLATMMYAKANSFDLIGKAQADAVDSFRVSTLRHSYVERVCGHGPGQVTRRFDPGDIRSHRTSCEGR